MSIRRLARAFREPVSSVGRWVLPRCTRQVRRRACPVSGDADIRGLVRGLANEPRNRTFGYRRIWALLRRGGTRLNRKTVWRIMHSEGLTRPKVWHRRFRPKRVEKMRPERSNQGWQIDMTSFMLSDLTPVFLVSVVDCCTREIVGWSLDRRCPAGHWTAAVRMALEGRGLMEKCECRRVGLRLRSDNGPQPCSKRFAEFLSAHGIEGQYTGYNAPDDNAYVERVIRTIKEEEIWPNLWDTLAEAREAIGEYVKYYNNERIHSALDYRTPSEAAAAFITLVAA